MPPPHTIKKKEKTCGDCKKHLVAGKCPRAEYIDREDNLAACWPTDLVCEKFEPKKRTREKKKREKKPKPILKDSGTTDEGYFEAIYHNDKPCFLVLEDKTFSLHKTVSWNDKTSRRI